VDAGIGIGMIRGSCMHQHSASPATMPQRRPAPQRGQREVLGISAQGVVIAKKRLTGFT
jgi:hypothetical protein